MSKETIILVKIQTTKFKSMYSVEGLKRNMLEI